MPRREEGQEDQRKSEGDEDRKQSQEHQGKAKRTRDKKVSREEPYGNFWLVSLIGIRLGRVSYHDQVQVQGLKEKKGGKILEQALFGVLGGFRGIFRPMFW